MLQSPVAWIDLIELINLRVKACEPPRIPTSTPAHIKATEKTEIPLETMKF